MRFIWPPRSGCTSSRQSLDPDTAVDTARPSRSQAGAQPPLDSLGPLHGYAIAARLEQVSGGALQLNMGTLYPALLRLEQRGLLRGNWGTTDTNRRARFYAVTPAGRRQLAREKQAWDRMAGIIHTL